MTDLLIIILCCVGASALSWFASKKVHSHSSNDAEVVSLKVKIAKLEQQIEDHEKHKEDDLKRWEEQTKAHREALEAVARDVLEKATDKTQSQLEQSHAQKLKEILAPVEVQFKGFQERVDKYYESDIKWRGELNKELSTLAEMNMGLNEQAGNLAKALKGDSKIQGDWGEYQLERILEDVGLTKGVHFSTQESAKDESGATKRPDFLVKLPDDKVLVIDSKVSLTAYERCVNADTEEEQAEHLKEHIQSMRNHIRGLSKKDYSSLYDKSVDYTLMFVPVEPAFFAAGAEIQSIQKEGLAAQVLLVSTSTIIATLRTISYIWRQEQQRKNVKAISDRGEKLYEKFVGFTKSMDSIGKSLQGADKAYSEAVSRLSTGNGNLVGQAEKLRSLGLNVKETIDEKFIEDASSEDVSSDDA
jgi:DNA recombination protein RmuC